MSYFTFLAIFVVIPIILFGVLVWRGRAAQPHHLNAFTIWKVIAAHILIAVVWTTPWDNYLVATRVWWYDPELVTGITFWYVPIEEYTFFVLQPIMTALFLVWLMRRIDKSPKSDQFTGLRTMSAVALAVLWVVMFIVLITTERGNYLGLELTWAIPPIMFQTAFGADILWKHRRVVLTSILIPTVYLSIADTVAMESGTWTINPTQSLNLHIFGVLPVEELLFFLITNTLVVFGCTLALAQESVVRAEAYVEMVRTMNKRQHITNGDH